MENVVMMAHDQDLDEIPAGIKRWPSMSKGVLRFLRFGLVGVASGLTFALVVFLGVWFFQLDPETSSVIGYAISIPLNFFGNRRFSFRSKQRIFGEVLRFLCVHALNMLASKTIMSVTTKQLGLHYFFGIALSIAIIPFLTYLFMSIWVFKSAPDD